MQERTFILLWTLLLNFLHVNGRGSFSNIGTGGGETEGSENCLMTVTQQIGCFFSPSYPHNYPKYSSCSYEVKRYSRDVCEVKLTFNTFSVAKSPNCVEDFLEIQDEYKTQRVCGVLPTGSEKYATFPADSDVLHLTFRGSYFTTQGFSIAVKQIRNSCPETTTPPPVTTSAPLVSCDQEIKGRFGRITSPEYPKPYQTGRTCAYTVYRSESRACRVELDFRSFDVEQTTGCHKDFLLLSDGSRLCGTLTSMKRSLVFPPEVEHITFMFTSDDGGIGGKGFDIQVTQLPGPCTAEVKAPSLPIVQQCDQEITSIQGNFTSPGYPNSFGPNYDCTYTVQRPDPSICELELQFVEFDVGRHNPSTCSPGAYFELPGRVRICHPYKGRKIIHVPEFKDPITFRFLSSSHSSGRGFRIEITQMPNTCKGYEKGYPKIPESIKRCYQEINVERGFFTAPKDNTCEFVIKRTNPTTCAVELQISLRGNLFFPCAANHIVLPDGQKLCIEISTLTKIPFPKHLMSLSLIYHGHDSPEFNLLVTQLQDPCLQPNVMEPFQKNPSSERWMWKMYPAWK